MSANYYVYVYIDPRSYEEFYYGKGKGARKDAHLSDVGDSAKVTRIRGDPEGRPEADHSGYR